MPNSQNKKFNNDRESLLIHSESCFQEIAKKHERTASINNIFLGYLEFGLEAGVPLIWAHGSGFTGYELVGVQAKLVDLGFRVIAIDYRGHGKTQIDILETNSSIYHVADDIVALMNWLDIRQAIVGGFSKGGWIAAAFYDAYPDRVMGLLLEDGGSFSIMQLRDDMVSGKIKRDMPEPRFDLELKLYDSNTYFRTRREGVELVMDIMAPFFRSCETLNFCIFLFSLFHKGKDELWRYHCDFNRLMGVFNPKDESFIYSTMPMMQRSQELMLPLVVFRNLHVPLHIIDPDSPTTELPACYLNEELKALHPKLVTHELYTYEYSPHGAHFEYPERFAASAKALLDKIKEND